MQDHSQANVILPDVFVAFFDVQRSEQQWFGVGVAVLQQVHVGEIDEHDGRIIGILSVGG